MIFSWLLCFAVSLTAQEIDFAEDLKRTSLYLGKTQQTLTKVTRTLQVLTKKREAFEGRFKDIKITVMDTLGTAEKQNLGRRIIILREQEKVVNERLKETEKYSKRLLSVLKEDPEVLHTSLENLEKEQYIQLLGDFVDEKKPRNPIQQEPITAIAAKGETTTAKPTIIAQIDSEVAPEPISPTIDTQGVSQLLDNPDGKKPKKSKKNKKNKKEEILEKTKEEETAATTPPTTTDVVAATEVATTPTEEVATTTNNTKEDKTKNRRKSQGTMLPSMNVLNVSSGCKVEFDGVEELTGRKKKVVAPKTLFRYTDDLMRATMKDKDYMTCEAQLVQIQSTTFLNLFIAITSRETQRSFGFLDKGTSVTVKLLNGRNVTLINNKTDIGTLDNNTGITTYKPQFILSSSDIRTLSESEIDYVRIAWSAGYEDYEIFDLDVLVNMFKCLK